jgi:hypothetical protein
VATGGEKHDTKLPLRLLTSITTHGCPTCMGNRRNKLSEKPVLMPDVHRQIG